MKDKEDAAIVHHYIEKDRIYDFFIGLRPKFDQVGVQIFGKEELPSLNETIAIVRAKDS